MNEENKNGVKIPEDWVETILENIAEINPKESLKKGCIAKSIPMAFLPSFDKKILGYEEKAFNGGTKFRNGDTLLARITPCLENGKTSYVDILDDNEVGFGSTEYIVIREKEGFSDQHFLYYLAISPKFREMAIKFMTGSSGRQRVQTNLLVNKKIILPPLPEQKAIASVLSSFDEKIELLREQNETLEDMGQAIFKEWFGKYSVDDELPEGWRVGKLGEVVDVFGGGTPSTKESSFWNGNIYWTSPKDLSNSKSVFLLNTEKKITEEGLKKISSGLFPRGSVLLSSRAPIGYLAISNIDVAVNQGYIVIPPNQYFSTYFMFSWLKKNMKKVINAANGSTFLEISKTSFRNIDCVIPSKNVLDDFDRGIHPVFEKILLNLNEIQNLSKTRDVLLPKLMRGEVRVKR